jgi:hypothetical protein
MTDGLAFDIGAILDEADGFTIVEVGVLEPSFDEKLVTG